MSKTIFITGTSSGFGKLTALTLAKAGYTVIAAMRGTTGKNADVARELSAVPNIWVIELDVTNNASVQTAVQQTLQKYGRIDVLINNAAVAGYGLLESYSLEQIGKMLDVNLYGVLRTYQAVLPSMRANREGLIINLTSGASGFTVPFMIPYLISKFGVESITEGSQDELRSFGIDNVSIQPGVYPTEMNNGSKPGINGDRPEIVAAYGETASNAFQALGTAFYTKMTEFNMNPQAVADGILKLVKMEKGHRPLRYPIDVIAQGTDQEFIDARAAIKTKWLQKYGYSL